MIYKIDQFTRHEEHSIMVNNTIFVCIKAGLDVISYDYLMLFILFDEFLLIQFLHHAIMRLLSVNLTAMVALELITFMSIFLLHFIFNPTFRAFLFSEAS